MKIPRYFSRFFAIAAMLTAGALVTSTITSCDVLKQVQGTYNMVHCKYEYRSLSGLSVGGIDLSKPISILDAPKLVALLSGNATSIQIGCTVNLNVQNPNATDAILNDMDYVLAIDGIDFTSGAVAHQLSIAPGGTGVLPVTMMFDVATLLRGESRDAVLGVMRNLLNVSGVGSNLGLSVGSDAPSKVTLSIRPSLNVGGNKITSPAMIPINFSFGGK
jgi:hypothetical protein